jgi:hypothetical protein
MAGLGANHHPAVADAAKCASLVRAGIDHYHFVSAMSVCSRKFKKNPAP